MNVRTRLFTITPSSAGKTCNRRTDHLSKHSPFIFNLPSTTIIPIPSIGRQLRTTHSPVPRGSSYTNRGLYEFLLSKWYNISWGWASWIISVYLICLADLVAEAHAYQFSSPYYACEDVQNYYAGVQNLRGEALKKKLNIIVSKHQSLPYKKVWDAIMILDAADVDAPGASSEVVEIYSLRAVSKSLAGKPEGWNREHLWPRSYGLLKGPSLTDLHNIRPADVNGKAVPSPGPRYNKRPASQT